MKIPIFDAAPNFIMTKQSRNETRQGNGLFGDILNLKMQSFQAESGTGTTETAEQDSTLNQVLANALKILEELKETTGYDLDEDEQELLQKAIDLLGRIDTESEGTAALLEALDYFVAYAGKSKPEGELDSEALKVVLNYLKVSLKQYDLLKNGPPSLAHLNSQQSQQRLLLTSAEQLILENGNKSTSGIESESLIRQPISVDGDETFPLSLRLQPIRSSNESEADRSLLATEPKDTQAGVQSKSDTNIGQASTMKATSEIDEVIVRLVETGSNERKARELVRQFTNILQRSNFSQALQTKSLTIRLYPEHLGSLRIELLQRDGVMIARILAATNMAKDLLDSQIHQLRQAFVQQNIQVDKVDITFQENMNKYTSQDQRNHGQEQQDPNEGKGSDVFNGENDEEDFSQFLHNVLFETEV
ncbi:flagellar hook-length control protein [Bacillus freudenreichii]|nr:flagellar hook-length control protein [Bacillus freudenreichii]